MSQNTKDLPKIFLFSPKNSCSHVNCMFWQSCINSFAKTPQLYRKNLNKQLQFFILKQFFLWKRSFGHVKWTFYNPVETFLPNNQKISNQNSNLQKFQFFSHKFPWTRTVQFWRSRRKLLPKARETST